MIGIITASYATGSADGGTGNFDSVGGLVGNNEANGTITASYATGIADGGTGTADQVGSLMGDNLSFDITASYGFGTTIGSGGTPGNTLPMGVTTASNLTAGNAGSSWNDASNNTLGAWDFGTATENPALVYNDYDGAGTDFASCSNNNGGFPDTIPGTATTLDCETTLVGNLRP